MDIGTLGNNVIESLQRLNQFIDMENADARMLLIEVSVGVGQLVAAATGQTIPITISGQPGVRLRTADPIPPEIIEPVRGDPLGPDESTAPVLCGVLKRLGKLVCGCGTETMNRGADLAWCPSCSHFCGLSLFREQRIDLSDDRFMQQCPKCSDGEGPVGMMRSVPSGELDRPCPTCALVPGGGGAPSLG